jgi:hypothetical protein
MADRAGVPLTIALVVIAILMMSTPAKLRPAASPVTRQASSIR